MTVKVIERNMEEMKEKEENNEKIIKINKNEIKQGKRKNNNNSSEYLEYNFKDLQECQTYEIKIRGFNKQNIYTEFSNTVQFVTKERVVIFNRNKFGDGITFTNSHKTVV